MSEAGVSIEQAAERANNLCLQALRALVELKDYKDEVGDDAEYRSRKDAAWAAARQALASHKLVDPQFGMHVDDWLDCPSFGNDGAEDYARFVIDWFRLPAWKQTAYKPFMSGFQLFCTYKENRYRCTGASRMGDVWLARDFRRVDGYDLRVDVGDCSDWSPVSEAPTAHI